MNWYLEVLKKYAVFSGRARRKEYWMFYLINIIIGFLIGFIEGLAHLPRYNEMGILSTIYNLAVFIPGLAVAVRRLHDTGRSGWWATVSFILVVPFVLLFLVIAAGIFGSNHPPHAWQLFALVLISIYWVVMFIWLVLDSTPGDNEYGPNPKEEEHS